MAEFQKVMAYWERMCDSVKCFECPIHDEERGGCSYDMSNAELEQRIMKWVEEHPM